MLLRPVNKSTTALLVKRVNESPSDGLGENLVAGIESLCGHDPQGKLARVQRAAGERFLAKIDRLSPLETAMNIDIGRHFLDIAGSFKDRDRRRYVCKIGPRLREPLFIVCD